MTLAFLSCSRFFTWARARAGMFVRCFHFERMLACPCGTPVVSPPRCNTTERKQSQMSYSDGLLERAELLAQDAADLADAGICLDCIHDRRHQTTVALSGLAQFLERAHDRRVVPPCFEACKVLALLRAKPRVEFP